MNVVFISPHFPPNYYLFLVRLREEGANVLGLGDAPYDGFRPELKAALNDYIQVPNLGEWTRSYGAAVRALGLFTWRHGKIDHLDSNNEYWLPLEADLRRDFNIPGQRPEDLALNRTKSGMKAVLSRAGLPVAPGEPLRGLEHARGFGAAHGYPLILKPDVGVGAAGAVRVDDERGLEEAVARVGEGYFIEKYLFGKLVSFDGLTDRDGTVLLCTSHVFNEGILDVVSRRGAMHYYSERELPADLEKTGREVVKAFGIRGRFFHVEFFRLADGSLRVLEVNVRPPGGFTTDMMNFAAETDVYRLWARMVTGHLETRQPIERKYHVAHVGRRHHLKYARSDEELMRQLGELVVMHEEMPAVLSGAMGDSFYLVRAPQLDRLQRAIAEIERPA